MACYFEQNPSEKGVVELAEDNRIIKMVEKPGCGTPASWSNGGIYVFKPEVLTLLSETIAIPYDLAKDLMKQSFFTEHSIYAYLMDEYLLDIGNLDSLAKAQAEVKDLKF
jgi:NDP-sugar pyrophosphorylase family protein